MYTHSLPRIPSSERIQAEAARIAAGIRAHLTYIEREPIAVYGRCLLLNQEPTTGQTLRFVRALRRFAPYVRAAGRLSTDLAALRGLQDAIARAVAVAEGGRS